MHQLNIPVLAEGIESIEQKNFLQSNHCDMIQGYFYGRPMSIETVKNIINSKNKFRNNFVDNTPRLNTQTYR